MRSVAFFASLGGRLMVALALSAMVGAVIVFVFDDAHAVAAIWAEPLTRLVHGLFLQGFPSERQRAAQKVNFLLRVSLGLVRRVLVRPTRGGDHIVELSFWNRVIGEAKPFFFGIAFFAGNLATEPLVPHKLARLRIGRLIQPYAAGHPGPAAHETAAIPSALWFRGNFRIHAGASAPVPSV